MDTLIESSIEMTEKINREHRLVVDANMIMEMLEELLQEQKYELAAAVRLVYRRITNFDYDNPTVPVQVSPPRYDHEEYSIDSISDNSEPDTTENMEGLINFLREQTTEESSNGSPISSQKEVENKDSDIILSEERFLSEDSKIHSSPSKEEINDKLVHAVLPLKKRPLSSVSDHRSSSSDQDIIDITDMVNMDSVWEADEAIPQKVRKTNLNKNTTSEENKCFIRPKDQSTPEISKSSSPQLPPFPTRGLGFTNVQYPVYSLKNVNNTLPFTPRGGNTDSKYKNPCDFFSLEQRRNVTNNFPNFRLPNLEAMAAEGRLIYIPPPSNENTKFAIQSSFFPQAVNNIPDNNNSPWDLPPDNSTIGDSSIESMFDQLESVTAKEKRKFFDVPLIDLGTPKTHTRSSTVTLNTLGNGNYDDVNFRNNDETDSSKVDGNNEELNKAQSDDVVPPVDGDSNEEVNDIPWHKYLGRLIAMFPDADTVYLNKKCLEADNGSLELHDIIDILLRDGYPLRKEKEPVKEENKKNLSWEELSNYLTEVLPNADPSYLEQECEKLAGDQEQLLQFVADRLEKKDYPKKEEYLKRLEIEKKVKMYTENFSVEEFLKIFPDPIAYFYEEKKTGYTHRKHSLAYLREKLRDVRCTEIRSAMNNFNSNLTKSYHDLMTKRIQIMNYKMRHPRSSGLTHMPTECSIPFYQEVAFLEHEDVIKEYLNKRKQEKEIAFKTAKEKGELLVCGVCFDDEVLPIDTATCTAGHIFCKSCIKTGVETDIGTGKTTFICFDAECSGEFDLKILQLVLDAVVFSRMLLRRQAEEVKAAGIEDLEGCPFCEFCTIPDPEDKIFKCLNPECLKESCRKCREPNHVPLRCEEVEKPQDIKARTYIEDQMTQALIRECWKCHQKFIKEDGCNKMTCRCGAKMCYLCRQPVKDYTHFNGQGGSEYQKCPLYSDNKALHVDAVKEAGNLAKKTIVNENPNINIMHDPTATFPTKPTTAKNPNNVNRVVHHRIQLIHNIIVRRNNPPAPPPRRRPRRN